jgi:hypothetical protein
MKRGREAGGLASKWTLAQRFAPKIYVGGLGIFFPSLLDGGKMCGLTRWVRWGPGLPFILAVDQGRL